MADAVAQAAGTPKRLDLQGIAKAYGATIAVRRVSLDIEAGEIHALLGVYGGS
jgi:ribose transport system ATP-binding protein